MNIVNKCIQKINRYIKTRKSALMFYKFHAAQSQNNESGMVDRFIDISDFETLKKLSHEQNDTLAHLLNSDCAGRFAKGSVLTVAMKDGEWTSYGWLARSNDFWIAEIDLLVRQEETDEGILYDFFTKEKFRGNGIYPSIINHLNQIGSGKTNTIYCYDTNIASQRGIQKAGGIYEGTFRHNSKEIVPYLRSHGMVLLGSKLKMFGLKYAK